MSRSNPRTELLVLWALLASSLLGACERGSVSRAGEAAEAPVEETLDLAAFRVLMNNVADGWSRQDVDQALSSFDPQAVYMEPPDIQLFVGHEQLRPYFEAVEPETTMEWHHLWVDEAGRAGAGEFTFHGPGSPRATHGVVVVELRNGKIAFWREFHRPGPAGRGEFLAADGKDWRWHIGNYPEPKEP